MELLQRELVWFVPGEKLQQFKQLASKRASACSLLGSTTEI